MILHYYFTPYTIFPATKRRRAKALPCCHQTAHQGTTEYLRNLLPARQKETRGLYTTFSGKVSILDGINNQIIMAEGTSIPIDDVRFIEGNLFDAYEQY